MKVEQIKVYEHTINGLFYSNMSMNESELRILIIDKNEKGQLNNIAQSVIYPSKMIESSKKFMTEIAIESCFEHIHCSVCHNYYSVITLSQSEIGDVCYCCWKKMQPSIPWKQLSDLKKYAKSGR